jgi:hypothetical protein
MQAWFQANPQRNEFRLLLNHVLLRIRKSSDLSDIVTLCGAIESLPDTGRTKKIASKGDVRLMTAAAYKLAEEKKLSITSDRIGALLGQLNRPSLPSRIIWLLHAVGEAETLGYEQSIVNAASTLRRMGAHGGSGVSELQPEALPTIYLLAGACALFDLMSAGFPSRTKNLADTPALRLLLDGTRHFAHMNARQIQAK